MKSYIEIKKNQLFYDIKVKKLTIKNLRRRLLSNIEWGWASTALKNLGHIPTKYIKEYNFKWTNYRQNL